MANSDLPFGFKLLSPFNPNYIQWYPMATTYGTAIFKQDLVGAPAALTGYVCAALGGDTRPGMERIITGVAGEVFGAVQGVYTSDGIQQMYHVASAAGDGVVAGYLAVCIDPEALYLAQEDSVGNSIAAASAGLNLDAIATHTGNTLTGVSKMELDSSSAAVTATLAMKLIRSWGSDTVASANCRWICKVNAAAMGDNITSPA